MFLNKFRRASARGFTLIELLVTLFVCAVGLLGLGKLQASALAESQVSRTRALMTYQAESLASLMRANAGFWAAKPAAGALLPGFTVEAGNNRPKVSGPLTLAPTTDACTVDGGKRPALCNTPADVAAADVLDWTDKFVSQFNKTATARVACNQTNGPVSCDITLSWREHYVAMNATTAKAVAAAEASDTSTLGNTLVLHVQP